MHLCLFEDEHVLGLRPLVETRPVYDLRLGGRTLLETMQHGFDHDELVLHTRPYLESVTAQRYENALVNTLPDGADVLFVNGRFVAAENASWTHMRDYANGAETPQLFVYEDTPVGAWIPNATDHLPTNVLSTPALPRRAFEEFPITSLDEALLVQRPWHLLGTLRPALNRDANAHPRLPSSSSIWNRSHALVHDSVIAINPDQIALGPGARIGPGVILNAEDGPIMIGANATIFERAVIKGPSYIGPRSEIQVGATIDGAAFGYWCKVGGAVHDTVIQSLSNKAHAGFLGHAYLGRWCNLGADTNNSNLKNDYGPVRAYAPADETFLSTERQFAGLFMGDHSKCGINTMFNTGTVIGTFCNLYGGDFPPRYVPPFSWGGPASGFTEYRLDKALEVAERVMGRRETPFSEADRALLTTLFRQTKAERDAHHS